MGSKHPVVWYGVLVLCGATEVSTSVAARKPFYFVRITTCFILGLFLRMYEGYSKSSKTNSKK